MIWLALGLVGTTGLSGFLGVQTIRLLLANRDLRAENRAYRLAEGRCNHGVRAASREEPFKLEVSRPTHMK